MIASLEVIILPVSDPDKSLDFYQDRLGFALDVDYAPTKDFRVVQLTPEGSSTSIQFGVGLTDARAGFGSGAVPRGDRYRVGSRRTRRPGSRRRNHQTQGCR